MKKRWRLVDRSQFIIERYRNYLEKKKAISEFPEELRTAFYMTDLDKVYDGETKPQKDLVLCDRCNQYIDDQAFWMCEDSYVYHPKCIASELPPDLIPRLENVVFLNDLRKTESDPDPDDDGGNKAS